MDSEFIDFYRDNEELADESDGYNHFFPEEKDEMEKDNETEDYEFAVLKFYYYYLCIK